jgi:hypothetical protein
MRPAPRLSLILILTLVLTALAAPRAVVAQEATPAGAGTTMTAGQFGVPELSLTLGADGFTVPSDVTAGRYLLTLTNQTADTDYIALFQPPEAWSLAETTQHIAAMNSDSATPEDWAWFYAATFRGGGAPAGQGGLTQWIADLSPGRWVLATFDTTGQAAELQVTGTMPTQLPTPPTNATVTGVGTTGHYDFAVDGTIHPGRQVLAFTNTSDQPHFIALYTSPGPLTDEQFHQVEVLAEGGTPIPGSDLPPLEDVLEGPQSGVISPGQTIWWIVSVEPGYYTLACYIPDRDFTPHAFEGMLEHLDVR